MAEIVGIKQSVCLGTDIFYTVNTAKGELMAYTLPPLPYELDDLEPHLSKDVVDYHYNKHTAKYYETASELAKGTIYEDVPFENLLTRNTIVKMETALFNNVSQAWNHTFYWNGLTPDATTPSDKLNDALIDQYGSMEEFNKQFTDKAIRLFGSGWVWLLSDRGKLKIVQTPNALSPLMAVEGSVPLLTCDVWEHAYYTQYPADRASYMKSFWKLVNWDVVSKKFEEVSK